MNTIAGDAGEDFKDALSPEHQGEVLVQVENVSKKFCRSLKKSLWYGLFDAVSELIGLKANYELRKDEFWALEDISFELRRGESLGLIGHNGTGKTTLLRMLTGLIKPDKGKIKIHGKVGAVIALGAGFNPILTGRENVYINASILGLSKKEIDSKIDEIIEFADIHDYMDSPVQTYSSGMYVRLGFAVAAVLIKPDVLILDEVLAVGDIGFITKCLNRMLQISQNSAVIFVSHNMQLVSLFCNQILALEGGKTKILTKNLAEGIDYYYSLSEYASQIIELGDVELLDLRLSVDDEILSTDGELSINMGSEVYVYIKVNVKGRRKGINLIFHITDQALTPVLCIPLQNSELKPLCLKNGTYTMKISIGALELNSGKYSCLVVARDARTKENLLRAEGLSSFRVASDQPHWGTFVRPSIPVEIQLLD